MNPQVFELEIEEEFALEQYGRTIERLKAEELRPLLTSLMRQLMVKDKIVADLVKRGGTL